MCTYILWRFLILETFVLGALCCPCVNEHPQKHFCKSEFVLKVEIHDELTTDQVFTMEIKKVFKGDARDLSLTENREVLLTIDKRCRVPDMANGDDYLIYGYSMHGMIVVSPTICNGIRSWRRMPQFLRRALEADHYKDNCNCSNEITYDANDSSKQNICKREDYHMKRSGEKCNWAKSTSFRRCLNHGFPGRYRK